MSILAALVKNRANTPITIQTPDGPVTAHLRSVPEGLRARFYDIAGPESSASSGEKMVRPRALLLLLATDNGAPLFASEEEAIKALSEAGIGDGLSLLADACLEHFNKRANPKAEGVSPKAPQPTGDSGQ